LVPDLAAVSRSGESMRNILPARTTAPREIGRHSGDPERAGIGAAKSDATIETQRSPPSTTKQI
jgi:hypothetical protein